MSRVLYSFAALPLDECLARFRDPRRFIAFCRTCERWNACWCCPPLTVDPEAYLRPYSFITFAAARIFFDDDEIAAANTPEAVRSVTRRALVEQKTRLFDTLLDCENTVRGSVQLASGGCHLCGTCARVRAAPCRHPEKRRFSLDSFGFDLTKICDSLLNIKLLWSDGASLPRYYTLTHALLAPRDASEPLRRSLCAARGRNWIA